jgi:hypothetical protein
MIETSSSHLEQESKNQDIEKVQNIFSIFGWENRPDKIGNNVRQTQGHLWEFSDHYIDQGEANKVSMQLQNLGLPSTVDGGRVTLYLSIQPEYIAEAAEKFQKFKANKDLSPN